MKLTDHFENIIVIDQVVDFQDQLLFDKNLSNSVTLNTLLVRFWTTQGIIFGRLDSLLPRFSDGLAYFDHDSIPTVIRKAGGLAVACDEGVLNLSLIFSKNQATIGGLNESFTFGVELMRLLLSDFGLMINDGEIKHSYCPGKYDLSVDGKKFAGMAQYRTKDAVMLMITIFVTGDQKIRAEKIRNFYTIANPSNDPKYPQIETDSMTTLAEMTNTGITVESLKGIMIDKLNPQNR